MKFAVVPVPVWVRAPGLAVIVQVPDEGNPLKSTLAVGVEQAGWAIIPTTGIGVPPPRVTSNEHNEKLPLLSVTVIVTTVFTFTTVPGKGFWLTVKEQ